MITVILSTIFIVGWEKGEKLKIIVCLQCCDNGKKDVEANEKDNNFATVLPIRCLQSFELNHEKLFIFAE